jgi:hypothetical protein
VTRRASITQPLLLLCAAIALAGGCRSAAPPAPAPPAASGDLPPDFPARAMLRTELIFGMSRDDGNAVSEVDWQKFVDDAVAVWFPNGFTIVDALGRWRGYDGKVVNERSKILIIFHDQSDETIRKFDELRSLYRQRFGQQAVTRQTSKVWAAF